MFFPARRFGWLISFFILLFILAVPQMVLAQGLPLAQATPTPGATTNWVESPVVTEVGKNADRARQLLFWIFSKPPVYSSQVLFSIWAIARNVAYAFVVLIIVMFAIGFVIAQRRGIPPAANLSSIIFKVAAVLLYITFSYIIVLLIIQFSEILMRFFIERVGGKDLFNIFFAGQSVESNYTDFVGFWDTNRNNLEMVNTSIFFIRLTTFTYNMISVMLVLRHIILWFLLIVSPFLALLMPFIFIRNTGWIWIGVFLQWIFYGPLFALFLAGLTLIWQAGIPYGFDFDRRDRMTGDKLPRELTVYPTSINILWGGPAQTLSFNNSANYVDTYAEYVIALVMLWTATFLPWLLLRIFRDYCCDILGQNQATLVQILDRLRSFGAWPPPISPGPTTTTQQAVGLPFRRAIEMPQRALLAQLTDLPKAQTLEIAQALNLSVTSIQDVAEFETNKLRQSQMETNLEALRNPATVSERELRERFSSIRSELETRATRGDQVAQRVVSAVTRRPSDIFRPFPQAVVARPLTNQEIARRVDLPESKVQEVFKALPTIGIPSTQAMRTASQKTGLSEVKLEQILATRQAGVMPAVVSLTTPDLARQVGVPEGKVKEVLQAVPAIVVPTVQTIRTVAQKTGVADNKVQQILASRRPAALPGRLPTAPPPVTVDDYEEVKTMWVNHYRQAPVPVSEKIKSRDQWLEEDVKKLTNVLNLLSSMDGKLKTKGVEEVGTLLPFLLLGGFSDIETVMYLKAKLAAAKQVLVEHKVVEEAREKAQEEVKREEELVEIEKKEEKKEEKVLEVARKLEKELPVEAERMVEEKIVKPKVVEEATEKAKEEIEKEELVEIEKKEEKKS